MKCTIWKNGENYRITVNDIRYRTLDTGVITDTNLLLEIMGDLSKELKEKEQVDIVFELVDKKESITI